MKRLASILVALIFNLSVIPVGVSQENAFGEEDLDLVENNFSESNDFDEADFAEGDLNLNSDFQESNDLNFATESTANNSADNIFADSAGDENIGSEASGEVNEALGSNGIINSDPANDLIGESNALPADSSNGSGINTSIPAGENIFSSELPTNDLSEDVVFSEDQSLESKATMLEEITEPNLFAGAPPVPGTMRILAENEAPEEYRVVAGDTLFDICNQLIDEPSYWPKLWSFNTFIKNPHFIYPGMILRFYPGGDDTPPFLQIVTEDDIVPVDKGPLDGLEPENIDGLLASFEPPSEIQVIGPEEVAQFPEIDEAFINVGSFFAPQQYNVIIPAFILPEKVSPLGEVLSGSGGSILLDTDEDLIIKASEGGLSIGESYSVLRYSESVNHPNSGGLLGYRYEFVGHIKLLKQLPDGQHLAAKVFMNRMGVQPGDLVVPFKSVKRSVPMFSQASQAAGHFVVGFEIANMNIAGKGSFVFLGSETGALAVGQTVEIYQNYARYAGAIDSGSLPDYSVKVAEAHVIDQSSQTSLAYIVKDNLAVRIGDSTGQVQ